MNPLGRLTPPDWTHVETHPFTALSEVPTSVPVVLGINWPEGFDRPIKGRDGRYRIKYTGAIRGGHCICAEPQAPTEQDVWPYHVFYDQGVEGACEGFGHSRALSLIYRKRFNAFWLYDDARRIDGNYPDGEGAYNRDACKALVKWGAHPQEKEHCVRTPWNNHTPAVSIKSYHWATDAEQVRQALGYGLATSEIPLLNSWGTAYPETVYISLSDVQRLLAEEGEASVLVTK